MNEIPLIDDFRPLSLLRPTSVAELGEIVRRAAAEGHGLYPIGGGTMLHLGNPPTKPGHAVELRGLDKVIDYPARDMTITVQAGITIAKLQEVLAAEGQRLPIDVPRPEAATLGGAIAVNASGARRYGFGTLRDYVIGISFTDDQGHEVKAGGRVVKNVAGYDLCKLQIGALGTLGIVTQVTLKVMPKPEDHQLIRLCFDAGELAAVLDRIHGSRTRPTCAVVTPPGPIKDIDFTAFVGFEGSREAVAWQVAQFAQEHEQDDPEVWAGALPERDVRSMVDLPWQAGVDLAFKATMQPSALAGFLVGWARTQDWVWLANAGNGVVSGARSDLSLDGAQRFISELRLRVGKGSVIVTQCPPAWKRELKVWGDPRGDWALMRKVKRELDPRALFNPGRFVV